MTSGPGDGRVQEHSADPESTTPLPRAKKDQSYEVGFKASRRTPWCLVSMNSLGTGFAFARHFAFPTSGS